METYGSLSISSGPGGEEVGRERKQEGRKTQMGNEPAHLSWENAFQSSRQQPSPRKKIVLSSCYAKRKNKFKKDKRIN